MRVLVFLMTMLSQPSKRSSMLIFVGSTKQQPRFSPGYRYPAFQRRHMSLYCAAESPTVSLGS